MSCKCVACLLIEHDALVAKLAPNEIKHEDWVRGALQKAQERDKKLRTSLDLCKAERDALKVEVERLQEAFTEACGELAVIVNERDALKAEVERLRAKHENEIRRLNGGDWLRERPMIDLLISDKAKLENKLAAVSAARDEACDLAMQHWAKRQPHAEQRREAEIVVGVLRAVGAKP